MDKKLSASQAEAVRHLNGPAMVTAGPGSGKTTVIAERIRNLVFSSGVDPGGILTITFTNAAAEEMKKRTALLMPDKASYLTFGTFHSIFFLILKHTYNLNSSNILKTGQRNMIINDIIKRSGFEVTDKKQLISDLAGLISRYKNTGKVFNNTEIRDEDVMYALNEYAKELEKMRLYDFDDMLLKCRDLFTKKEEVLAGWQKRYKYIQVDEFQDINEVQYEVVRLLSKKSRNLFVVGDDDQAIYGFRGSTPGIMNRFLADFPDAASYSLSVNYRSTKNIVDAATEVIAHNDNRIEKDIRSFKGCGEEVVIQRSKDIQDEIGHICNYLNSKKANIDPSQAAILLRTNSMSAIYARGLKERGIICHTGERGINIYKSGIGRDVLDYMKFALGDNSRAVFLNIMNKPDRQIYRGALDRESVDMDKLLYYYNDDRNVSEKIRKLVNDRMMLSRLRPGLALHYLFNAVGYMDYLRHMAAGNNDLFSSYKNTADDIMEGAGKFKSISEWIKAAERGDFGSAQQKGVSILTMHASKGLEFDTVIIPDVNEGMLPYSAAVMTSETEEERRLFYVALTRAKNRLCLLYAEENAGKKRFPSRFLEEMKKRDRAQSSIPSMSSLNS